MDRGSGREEGKEVNIIPRPQRELCPTESRSENRPQDLEKGHSHVSWVPDSLQEGFRGHRLVAGSEGALGVHQHATRPCVLDELQLLRAAF